MKLALLIVFAAVYVTVIEGCNRNSQCASGFCDGGSVWRRGNCRPLVADGGRCLEGNDAKSCVSRQCTCGYCGRKMADYKRCSTNDNCRSGWCHSNGRTIGCRGTCRPKSRDGQRCQGGSDANSCVSGQCTCGYCGRKMANYKRCSTNDNCRSGWCHSNGRTIGCHGTCRPKSRDGQRCQGGSDANSCVSGQCTCGSCGRKMAKNYRCSTNDNCLAGLKCFGLITVGCKGICIQQALG